MAYFFKGVFKTKGGIEATLESACISLPDQASSLRTIEGDIFIEYTTLCSRTDCFQFPSKRIIDNNTAVTKQNTTRRTISK